MFGIFHIKMLNFLKLLLRLLYYSYVNLLWIIVLNELLKFRLFTYQLAWSWQFFFFYHFVSIYQYAQFDHVFTIECYVVCVHNIFLAPLLFSSVLRPLRLLPKVSVNRRETSGVFLRVFLGPSIFPCLTNFPDLINEDLTKTLVKNFLRYLTLFISLKKL